MISGSGLASARISGFSASKFSQSGFRTFGAESPRKTSAPASTSGRRLASVALAYRAMLGGMASSRPSYTTPFTSVSVTLPTGKPIATSRSTQASAAAPAPLVTSLISSSRLPCRSSWNTGMPIRARSRRSISKHSGALMSSRLMAPNVGSSAATTFTNRSGSAASTSMSNTSMPANFLNRTALPSITGLPASAPILPSPSTAVPFEMTATRLPRAVRSRAASGSATMASHAAATPGE